MIQALLKNQYNKFREDCIVKRAHSCGYDVTDVTIRTSAFMSQYDPPVLPAVAERIFRIPRTDAVSGGRHGKMPG